MADCEQLQALLDDAIQNRQDLNDPTYCDDFPDPEQCRKNLGAQKQDADRGIQDIKQNMFICSVLIGTWAINADSPDYTGQIVITSYDAQTAELGGIPFDAGRFVAGTNELAILFPGLTYRGILDVTTHPPTLTGTYSRYDPMPEVNGTWTGQKL